MPQAAMAIRLARASARGAPRRGNSGAPPALPAARSSQPQAGCRWDPADLQRGPCELAVCRPVYTALAVGDTVVCYTGTGINVY